MDWRPVLLGFEGLESRLASVDLCPESESPGFQHLRLRIADPSNDHSESVGAEIIASVPVVLAASEFVGLEFVGSAFAGLGLVAIASSGLQDSQLVLAAPLIAGHQSVKPQNSVSGLALLETGQIVDFLAFFAVEIAAALVLPADPALAGLRIADCQSLNYQPCGFGFDQSLVSVEALGAQPILDCLGLRSYLLVSLAAGPKTVGPKIADPKTVGLKAVDSRTVDSKTDRH